MTENNQLTKKATNQKSKELSYTQKCIILANLVTDKKKVLINSFDNIPLVKLYTANLKQENFVYSKIKGALCLLYEEENKNIKYYLQIYDINYFSLAFNLQVNQKMVKDLIKIEQNFFCLPTKFHFLGFKFNSKDSMEKFIKFFKCEEKIDKKALDINLKGRDFKCAYKDIIKIIKDVKSDFEKKFKAIDSVKDKIEKEKDKNIFQKFDELYYLINCVEYDEENKKFNVFIDKTFNPKIIQPYIDIYKKTKNKSTLNLRIIFDDYTHIYNKKIYVDLLINNLWNNFEETKRLIIFKREHKKRHVKEDFEESKRINSDYYGTPSDNQDKFRNSAIIPKPKFNNELKRKSNIAGNKSFKTINSFNVIDSIKEKPEEQVDHLKIFNDNTKK
jgi:hypothetical protein